MGIKAKAIVKNIELDEAYFRVIEMAGGKHGWRAQVAIYINQDLSTPKEVEIITRAPAARMVGGKMTTVMVETPYRENREAEPLHVMQIQAPYKDGESPFQAIYQALKPFITKEFSAQEIEDDK